MTAPNGTAPLALAVVVFVLAAVGSAAVGGGAGGVAATGTANEHNVTTQTTTQINASTVLVNGTVTVGNHSETSTSVDPSMVTAYVEYRERSSAGGEWQRTGERTAELRVEERGSFGFNVTGLQSGTTYEFRVVAERNGDVVYGDVLSEQVPTATPTRTPTPNPCPTFRGASGLCTTTPTPTYTPRPTPVAEDPGAVEVGVPDDEESADDWLGGLLPVFAWFALVGILAPLVLGGLVGLDSLRGRE
jgi:hypothetical protein